MSRLKILFNKELSKSLQTELGFSSPMQVPRLKKITINMGVGEAVADKKIMTHAVEDLTRIAGQKPIVTLARKSVAGFKIRQGWPIGCKVTLRGERMYEFFDKLINVSLPRVRDFRGIKSNSFDGRGNFNLGIKEQIIFPEIEFEKVNAIRGMDIAITTSAQTDQEGKALLKSFGFPFSD